MTWRSDDAIDAANQDALLSLDLVKRAGPELAPLSPSYRCTFIDCDGQQEDGDLCTFHADLVRDGQPFEAGR